MIKLFLRIINISCFQHSDSMKWFLLNQQTEMPEVKITGEFAMILSIFVGENRFVKRLHALFIYS